MNASPLDDERTAEQHTPPQGHDAPRSPQGHTIPDDDDPDEALRLQRAQLLAELLVETLGEDETRRVLSEALAPHGGTRVSTSVRGAVDRVIERLLTLTNPALGA